MENINKFRIFIASIGFGAFLMTSCEDIIEVNAPSNQIGTVQVFEDVQTANSALSGLYTSLRNQSIISGGGSGMGALLGSYTDELDCYYNDLNGYRDIYLNLLQSTNTPIERLWDFSYQQIYASNSIIQGVNNSVSLSEEDKDRIKGEAMLVRSLLYYYLQQLFGDIPYTTSTDYEYNRQLSKLEESELLTQLETDLIEVTTLLEDAYRDTQRIYPNRKVAELLLAKVYLTQNKWIEAEQTVMNIIQSGLYSLSTDINEVFHNTGTHILWQIKPQNSGDSTQEASFYYFMDSAPNSYTLTQDLVDVFSDDDLRKQNWIASVIFNGQSWYRPYKYKNLSGSNHNEYSVVYRIEEAYFIAGEALAKQNRLTEAISYLNAIRERAGLPSLNPLSQEDFINELLLEKRREFFAEFGHRFFDLKRFGKLEELNIVKPNWTLHHRLLPLPQKELLLNQNLTPQNQGYQ